MYSFGDATRPIELKEMDGLVKLDAGDKKAFVNTISVF
jgi:hypothetical protein